MSDYENLDDLLKQESTAYLDVSIPRKFPSKKPKGFNAGITATPDPEDPRVRQVMNAVLKGDTKLAKEIIGTRFTGDDALFMNAYVDGFNPSSVSKPENYLWIREVLKGKRGIQSRIEVVLGYDENAQPIVVRISKGIVYAVDGRKLGIKAEILPSADKAMQLTTQTTAPVATPVVVTETEATPPPVADAEASGEFVETQKSGDSIQGSQATPASSTEPATVVENDELTSLLGNDVVALLDTIGLRSKVKIESLSADRQGSITIFDGRNGSPVKIRYANGDEERIAELVSQSVFTDSDDRPYSPDDMGSAIERMLKPMLSSKETQDNRSKMVDALRKVSKHMDSLSRVFGFDEQQQLEAFFAAWMMKDSTCRLTGIPGTGKTTVIEAAATLLSNSYGYSTRPRFYKKDGKIVQFPSGQAYNVNYGSKDYEATRRMWEEWRFNDWEVYSETSGAYNYDFRFLQANSDDGRSKKGMTPERFCDILYAKTEGGKPVSKPVTESLIKSLLGSVPRSVKQRGDKFYYGGSPLMTDAGGNEGFGLREFLLDHFYDDRLNMKRIGIDLIANEMLMETGIAKIDYDKRAEEILYGIEIRQVTRDETVGESTQQIAEYQFEPSPRPIVTQPIKFFNEANRSGSGVEDAVLGLIAEKTVEYRGRTFKSPSFVAWMDTNPHQKGNDLAFVDRIDMELYFGTLTLGGRFSALSERYGNNAKGAVPQHQLIEGIRLQYGSKDFIRPMRFKELSDVWGLIGGIPFNASGIADTEGGSLLDISLLSVLFTQRFMVQGKQVKIMNKDHDYSYDNDVYASPLVDISTTTNLQYTKQHEQDIQVFMGIGDPNAATQAPVLIKRMLGFRFTNSLIKMTRALAFLRGKDYVTRQEVIDALPYCVGHRLGPAREGEDPKGRDIGIDREQMLLTNEQQFIKELIVHGYLLRDTSSLLGTLKPGTPSMFDVWDAFLSNCRIQMMASDSLWKYEQEILLPLKQTVRKGGNITPVHWGIGTMVVENKRNTEEYQENYKHLLELISRPEAKKGDDALIDSAEKARQIAANKSLYQYYEVRGIICNNMMLFSDDRARLLELIDSKINSIGGGTLNPNEQVIVSASQAVSYDDEFNTFTNKVNMPSTSAIGWRHYNDGLGAWGRLITGDANAQVGVAKLGATGGNNLDINGVQYEAAQELSLVGDFTVVGTGMNAKNDAFYSAFENVFKSLSPYAVGEGVLFGIRESSGSSSLETLTIDEWAARARKALGTFTEKGGKPEFKMDASQGFMGCFPLNHVGSTVSNPNVVGDDHPLLWLRLKALRGDNSSAGNSLRMILCFGITSKLCEPTKVVDGVPTEWAYLALNDDMLNVKNYSTNLWSKKRYEDSGNLTKEDYRFYAQEISRAILGL